MILGFPKLLSILSEKFSDSFHLHQTTMRHSIAICIPTWNCEELFEICFNALIKQLTGLEETFGFSITVVMKRQNQLYHELNQMISWFTRYSFQKVSAYPLLQTFLLK